MVNSQLLIVKSGRGETLVETREMAEGERTRQIGSDDAILPRGGGREATESKTCSIFNGCHQTVQDGRYYAI